MPTPDHDAFKARAALTHALPSDRFFAFVAFLLLVTALLLPWWLITLDDGTTEARGEFHAFRPQEPWTTSFGPWLTGILAGAAVALLFVRLAAGSHLHEPASWRRDLAVAAGLVAAAVASCLLWPAAVPWFWGDRTHVDPEGIGPATTESAMPGLGWWLALLALALTGLAAWKTRRADSAQAGKGEAGEAEGAGDGGPGGPDATDR
jgi:hypothetical protein